MMHYSRLILILLLALSMVISPMTALAQTSNGPYSEEVTGETITIEVPDCPGVLRTIDARNVPPSIYPKPCGPQSGSATNNLGQPTGEYGSGLGAPPAGTLFWTTTCGQTFNITQGMGTHAIDYSNYDYTLGVTGHPGVDVGMPVGTPLCSPVAGKVTVTGGTGYFYNTVESRDAFGMGELRIELPNGDQVVMGHMSRITVSVGQTLTVGQPVGDSGYPAAPHLHLEYLQKGHSTPSGFQALDPREVFGVPAGSAPTSGNGSSANPPAVPTGTGASGPSSMSYFQEKYGFIAPTGQYLDISQYQQNFVTLRDWAIKVAPLVQVEPEMIVWWTIVETQPPYDSYSYSNCADGQLGIPAYTVDVNCPAVYSGGWQIGYGQQYVVGAGGDLAKAFTATRGSPSDATLVQRLGQEVLDKAGIDKQFPLQNIDQLEANGSYSSFTAGNYWLFTIMKDPGVSAYLLGQELASDIAAAGGNSFMDHMCGWGSYYCRQDTLQKFANGMNDVIKAWGVAGTGATSSASCSIFNTPGTGTGCSTQPDQFNSMEGVDEFVSRINENIEDYKRIAACGDVPWEMMAAIHHRETALLRDFRGNNGGPWQVDPPQPNLDEFDFYEAGCHTAQAVQDKARTGPIGQPLRPVMDPANPADARSIKDAFWGYNGRVDFSGFNQEKGCKPDEEGQEDWDWDCAPYVMNNWDDQHVGMCFAGSIDGGDIQSFCPDPIDGAWKVYYKLVFSTYDSDGKLLVYGGKCVQGNAVVDGLSLPTDAGKSINSQFFGGIGGGGGSHIGIDIGNVEGDPVYAIADGEVIRSRWTFPQGGGTSPTGYYIIIKIQGPGGERWVYYGHMAAEGMVPEGSTVKAGQQIGTTGALMVRDPNGNLVRNGITGGPHLHFDIRTTSNEGQSISQHVNPCELAPFAQGYPDLVCPGRPGGAPW